MRMNFNPYNIIKITKVVKLIKNEISLDAGSIQNLDGTYTMKVINIFSENPEKVKVNQIEIAQNNGNNQGKSIRLIITSEDDASFMIFYEVVTLTSNLIPQNYEAIIYQYEKNTDDDLISA